MPACFKPSGQKPWMTSSKSQVSGILGREFKERFVSKHKEAAVTALIDAQPDRSTPANSLRQEHAADHQGHEGGLGGQAAACAGTGPGGVRPVQIIRRMLVNVAQAAEEQHEDEGMELLARRPEKRIQLLVVTADRGLAGAFNSNVIRSAQKFIQEHSDAEIQLELIGRKEWRLFPQAAQARDRRLFHAISESPAI